MAHRLICEVVALTVRYVNHNLELLCDRVALSTLYSKLYINGLTASWDSLNRNNVIPAVTSVVMGRYPGLEHSDLNILESMKVLMA